MKVKTFLCIFVSIVSQHGFWSVFWFWLWFLVFSYRLGVSILNKPQFTNEVEGLFGVFDGGRNDEVIKIIDDVISDTVLEEARQGSANQNSLKYAMLSIHR